MSVLLRRRKASKEELITVTLSTVSYGTTGQGPEQERHHGRGGGHLLTVLESLECIECLRLGAWSQIIPWARDLMPYGGTQGR